MLEITTKTRLGYMEMPGLSKIRYAAIYHGSHGYEPWFVAKDVAEVLGYAKPETMYNLIEDSDKVLINPQTLNNSDQYTYDLGATSIENTGSLSLMGDPKSLDRIFEGNINVKRMIFINEPGLYDAILGSRMEIARKFQHWVTHDVLPSLRQYGCYFTPAKLEEMKITKERMQELVANIRRNELIRKGVKYPEWFEYDAKYREWEEKIVAELDKMRAKEGDITRDQMIRKINTAMWNAAHVSTVNLQRSFSNKQLMNLELAEQIPTEEDMRIFTPENINLLWAIYCDSKVCPLFTKYVLQGNYYMAKDVKPVRKASFREVKFW